jgi:dTDP-4-dehydrorhamnose 3,5-epimerase
MSRLRNVQSILSFRWIQGRASDGVRAGNILLFLASVHDREIGMNIREFDVPGVKLILPKRFSDARGHFSETWNDRLFREMAGNVTFVQDNQSISTKKGTVRGLHFQRPPFAQGKLVRVLRGSIFDVVVDIRNGSPTYRRHVGIKLDAIEGAQLWVPPGFLHGFCTLEDETDVFYKVTAYYSPDHDAGVLWNDPDLRINWPVEGDSVVLSEKDRRHPRLCDTPDLFEYDG